MDKYQVKINPKAVRDLDSIYAYIAKQKQEPENARNQVGRIQKAILNLDIFPDGHQERMVGRYAGKGYRQLLIDRYLVIFRINKSRKIVTIVTIQYEGRNI